jgi:hypothetical protein
VFNCLAAVSLVLGVAVVVLWVKSSRIHKESRVLFGGQVYEHEYEVDLYPAELVAWIFEKLPDDARGDTPLIQPVFDAPGIRVQSVERLPGNHGLSVGLSRWWLMILTGIGPALYAMRVWHRLVKK